MFPGRLRELRKSRNMTQPQLAQLLGIAKSTVSMYENGRREPDLETLEAIADIFNVDLNSLASKTKESLLLTAVFLSTQVASLKYPLTPKLSDGTNKSPYFLAWLLNSTASAIGDLINK